MILPIKIAGMMCILLSTPLIWASSLTIRDIQVKGNQVEIQLDGNVSKGSVDLDYVRDIVQFSIQNSTIYPAKILHSDNQAFTKVFAYQYAPSLVRVRFSVEGQADAYRGKVKWQQQGKLIIITFPDNKVVAKVDNEKSLLAKVLGTANKDEPKAEVVKVEPAPEAKADSKTEKTLGANNDLNSKKKAPQLGGTKSGPSAFRSFLAMFLVVGGLGVVLFYVKRKQGGQAKRVGNSWLSNLLPEGMRKQKSLIEVIAQHPLGPKQSITVIRIRGQQFVLGVTQDNVQLISQLDVDEAELDLLEDPAVAASIGKMFGGKPRVEPVASFGSLLKNSPEVPQKMKSPTAPPSDDFDALEELSASAMIGRGAYQAQKTPYSPPIPNHSQGLTQIPVIRAQQSGIRDQIRRRLEGMKNV
jgi:flagellar biogenesis protein FliO